MNYEEFAKYKDITDNKFVKKFDCKCGNTFYLEPAFYTQLISLKEIYPNDFPKVIAQMKKVVEQKKLVSFVYDYENPFLPVEGSVFLEITDITDPIKVFYEDKSRGSDYGD